ncbi:MAG: IclR family transcriptional regulator [Methylobacterium sp.]|jgi:IclR family pca regulon transcriptional regulator|nr:MULTISPECIES: IclR family transcriptional regulator [Methylobacterium]MBZ6411690.1 IclR family transcriptional regulator [Methylobacterium sp.]SFE43395.1 transcriptional regulator, IclR family [Methylobacterium sp. yr596]
MSTDVSGETARSRLFVHSVEKCFSVLEAFHGVRALSLQEISERSGHDKSTCQRMVHTLAQLGYLDQCATTRRYALADRVLDLSYAFLRHHPLIERATPILMDLRRTCDARVDLSLFSQSSLVYALRLQARAEHYYTNLVGRRIPLFCSAGGRAVLAVLAEPEARALVTAEDRRPLTRFTRTGIEDVMTAVAEARCDGYAVAAHEVIEDEVVVAVALTDAARRPFGALHVAGEAGRWGDPDEIARILPGLMRAAALVGGAPA